MADQSNPGTQGNQANPFGQQGQQSNQGMPTPPPQQQQGQMPIQPAQGAQYPQQPYPQYPAGMYGAPGMGGMGAGQPMGAQGMGMGMGAPMGGMMPPPPPPEDNTPANYQIGQHLPKVIDIKVPAHQLKFDEQHFLHLLAGSISLTREEKKRIVTSIPRLRQGQIDELVRIFEEERRKFAELSTKHVEQLKKLEKQHWADWQDIEAEQKAESRKQDEANQAEEIRKKLGL